MGVLTSRGYNLQNTGSNVGDVARGYKTGIGMQDLYRKNQIAGMESDLRKGELGAQKEFMEGGGIGQDDAINKAFKAGSAFQKEVATGLGMVDQRTGQVDKKKLGELANFGVMMSNATPEEQNALIAQRANYLEANNRNPEDTLDLVDMNQEERAQAVKMIKLSSLPPEQAGKIIMQEQGPKGGITAQQQIQNDLNERKFKFEQDRANKPKAALPDKDIQKFEYYQGLLKTDPASAKDFAARFMDGESTIKPLPSSITEGMSPEDAQKVNDIYIAAGGEDKGMKAVQKTLDKIPEANRRKQVPQILAGAFPLATPEEMKQLTSIVDSAKTTESGIKEAGKHRDKQRRLVKFNGFRETALGLIDGLLANDELADITGPVEGAEVEGTFFKVWGDKEADAVNDIQQIKDIMTSDNLKLMTGVLSKTDIDLLANLAGGALNRTRGDERFRGDLIKLQKKLNETTPIGRLAPSDKQKSAVSKKAVNWSDMP